MGRPNALPWCYQKSVLSAKNVVLLLQQCALHQGSSGILVHFHTCQPPSKKRKDYASKNSGFYVKSRDTQIVLVTEER